MLNLELRLLTFIMRVIDHQRAESHTRRALAATLILIARPGICTSAPKLLLIDRDQIGRMIDAHDEHERLQFRNSWETATNVLCCMVPVFGAAQLLVTAS